MHRAFSTIVLAALAIDSIGWATLARADVSQADRIEEDWELVITSPDPAGAGPQITTSMSPTGDIAEAPFVRFNLNYRDQPSFSPGGLQVQVWSDKQLLSTSSQKSASCSTENETITWTQRMTLVDSGVFYSIRSGNSTTWGNFGESLNLTVYFASSVGTLAGYSPAASVSSSGVGWQSNRVGSMTLKRVRYYEDGDLISTDATPRSIPLEN